MDKLIDCYNRHKNLKIAADEIGIKWQTLYCHLKRNNVAVTGDKSRYGSDKDKLAAKAEMIFKSLVPNAIDQNSIKFQSKFDFIFDGEKIDIKASRLAQGCKQFKSKRWSFSVKKQEFCADFIVGFAFYEGSDDYKLYLIPGEIVRNYQTISISENGKSKWHQYQIEPNELNDFFLALTEKAA